MVHTLRFVFRLLLRALLGFISFVVLYLVCALGLGFIPTGKGPDLAGAEIAIFVRTNGVHTDFVLPVQSSTVQWSSLLPYKDFGRVDSTFQYLAFGWGDKGFYLNTPTFADLTCSTAFNALFFLSTTAMHVTYVQSQPREDESCRRMVISESQYRMLATYIRNSFQTNEAGTYRLISGKGYGARDNFYEAKGTYSFLRTCNVWTGGGLREIGIRTPLWSPFDKGIFYYLPQPK